MTYEIKRDGSYFRILFNGEYDDSDPLYLTTSEAQKVIDRYRALAFTNEQNASDKAFTFLQSYFV